MKTKFNLNVPFFPGFYESRLLNSDTWEHEIDEDAIEHFKAIYGEDITEEYLDFDYKKLEHDLSAYFIEIFTKLFNVHYDGFIVSSKLDYIDHPAYYNFRSDEIYGNFNLSEKWQEDTLKFMADNKEWLTELIKNDWTSHDGFLSNMSNKYEDWLAELSKEEPGSIYVETMMLYMLLKEENDPETEICDEILENIYYGNYVVCTKK